MKNTFVLRIKDKVYGDIICSCGAANGGKYCWNCGKPVYGMFG